MRPAKEVGGDFYDMFLLPDGRLVMSVGDVSGKGVPAALFMSATQTALRYVLRRESDLAAAIGIVNELLCATNSESMFVTLFSAVLNLDDGTLDYCNCGHLDVMLLRRDGTTEILPPVGMAVGILDRARFAAQRIHLAPGDRLFLFTDGLPDAADPADNPFGEDRLSAVAEAARLKGGTAFVDHILDEVEGFAQGAAQFDDITILALTYGAPQAAG
jgi:serine phosphatase RsbU (regulator of sigma subunit)